jgi:hypothetical protein
VGSSHCRRHSVSFSSILDSDTAIEGAIGRR